MQSDLISWLREKQSETETLLVGRPRLDESANRLRRLEVLFTSGVPILECLETLQAQEDRPEVEVAFGRVCLRVCSGHCLHQAFAAEGGLFPDRVLAIVKLGEESGQLASALGAAADSLERESNLVRRVTSALTYPAVLATLSLGVTGCLMAYFIPQLLELAESSGVELTGFTALLFTVAGTLKEPLVLGAGVQVVLAVGFVVFSALRTEGGRRRGETMLLRTPLVGSVLLDLAHLRFAHGLRTLLECGCPLVQTLRMLGDAAQYASLRDQLESVRAAVINGDSLVVALKTHTTMDACFLSLLGAGEQSGRMNETLTSAIELKEAQLHETLEVAVALIEPLVMAFIGLLVGLVTLMFFVPMAGLVQNL